MKRTGLFRLTVLITAVSQLAVLVNEARGPFDLDDYLAAAIFGLL